MDNKKGRKQKLKGGDEYDVLYAKNMYCYLINRPKNVKDVKRRLNRRERQEAKRQIDEVIENDV